MTEETRPSMTEKTKQQLSGLLLLDRIINKEESFHLSLMERDEQALEPMLKFMESEGLLEISEDDLYAVTKKGDNVYQKLIQQQVSYITHFEIYAYVDLGTAEFANPEDDFLEDDRWTDLRVAVGEFKKIDPHRIVFLAMLSDEVFFENPDWKFDLALGTLFNEMEAVVQDQVSIDELGYEDEDGEWVSGDNVMQDVIELGSQLNQEHYEQNEQEDVAAQRANDPQGEEVITTTTYYDDGGYGGGYSPLATFGAYAASAMFVDSMWHGHYW